MSHPCGWCAVVAEPVGCEQRLGDGDVQTIDDIAILGRRGATDGGVEPQASVADPGHDER